MKKSDRNRIRALLEKTKAEIIQSLRDNEIENQEPETGDEVDKSTSLANTQLLQNLRTRLTLSLEKVLQTLQRLDTDSFGLCVECEEPIPMPRLLIAPTALFCLPCQEDFEEEMKQARTE
jgi:DnaK suppressor protein